MDLSTIDESFLEGMTDMQKAAYRHLHNTIHALIEINNDLMTFRDGTTNYEKAKHRFEVISRKFV